MNNPIQKPLDWKTAGDYGDGVPATQSWRKTLIYNPILQTDLSVSFSVCFSLQHSIRATEYSVALQFKQTENQLKGQSVKLTLKLDIFNERLKSEVTMIKQKLGQLPQTVTSVQFPTCQGRQIWQRLNMEAGNYNCLPTFLCCGSFADWLHRIACRLFPRGCSLAAFSTTYGKMIVKNKY